MAERPVFIPSENPDFLVVTKFVSFSWFSGFSVAQKQRSISSLHSSIFQTIRKDRILEISSKSLTEEGVEASAFNLMIETRKYNRRFSVECAFQASKVFTNGGPYVDLLERTSREAKKDDRLRSSGRLVGFQFYHDAWPLEPKTLFYDWLYINALNKNKRIANAVLTYDCFTDIEFNHEKSINCQAYSAALYVALAKRNLLTEALQSPESYRRLVSGYKYSGAYDNFHGEHKLL